MPKKTVPKYGLHKGSGQACVKISGKRIYLGVHGTPESYRRYAEEIAKWQPEQEQAPTELTVGQLTLLYNEYAKGHYRKNGKPTSELHVVRAAMRALNAECRHLPANGLTPRRFKAVRSRLVESGTLCRKTINKYMQIIRRMVTWAVGEELLPPERLVALQAVPDLQEGRTEARESEPVKPVPLDAVEIVKPFLSPPLRGAVDFQLLTGARPSEGLRLRLRDVDRSGEVWVYRPDSHKTEHHGKAKIILIGPKAQAIVQEHLQSADPDAYVFAVPRTEGKKAYRRDSYTNAIKRACEKAFGMPKELRNLNSKSPQEVRQKAADWREKNCWHPHQLRHTAGTVVRKSADAETAQIILGHAKLETTEIYAERDLAKAASVVKLIG